MPILGQIAFNLSPTTSQIVMGNVVEPLVSSFFTVVGGAVPIAILIYFFSKKERKQLQAHADAIEKTLPIQEQLLKKYAQIIEESVSPTTVEKSLEYFKGFMEAQNMVEENKKFIKYAKEYNFISAVGHVLRMASYMPKNLSEHKEISKNILQ